MHGVAEARGGHGQTHKSLCERTRTSDRSSRSDRSRFERWLHRGRSLLKEEEETRQPKCGGEEFRRRNENGESKQTKNQFECKKIEQSKCQKGNENDDDHGTHHHNDDDGDVIGIHTNRCSFSISVGETLDSSRRHCNC